MIRVVWTKVWHDTGFAILKLKLNFKKKPTFYAQNRINLQLFKKKIKDFIFKNRTFLKIKNNLKLQVSISVSRPDIF